MYFLGHFMLTILLGRANREHWETLFGQIYGYFVKNPLEVVYLEL